MTGQETFAVDGPRERGGWHQASSEVSIALLSGAEPGAVLDLVAAHATTIADADLSVICLPEEDELVIDVVYGAGDERYRGMVLPQDNSGAGRAFRTGAPVITYDLPPDDEGLVSREPDRWAAGLYVPLGVHGTARGVLGTLRRPGHAAFTPEVTATLQAFANQAAVAMEVAERRRDAERLAVFADRDRIARDLHDLVIQRLFAIGMQLESASRLVEHIDTKARLHHAIDDLDATIREIRGTIYALHSSPADEPAGSVRTRVLHLIDSATEQFGFPPSVKLAGAIDGRIPPVAAEQLFAVLRESLSNVARHAKATWVDVRIEAGDALVLRVRDNGVGLPSSGRRSGLANMRQRAADLGGSFSAGPRAGGGTELVWTVPLPQ
ncbi:MAG TPA: GAF domain-containing sensor histidine kinase [Jatrophihabitantaceae bacterium]|nr:GAF domain-containing sensor histidine kinase [Jatrophihabitantaceae bacterium]